MDTTGPGGLPKRLAARIKAAADRLNDCRIAMASYEDDVARSSQQLQEFNEDPVGWAARDYPRHGVDSYPVQTRLTTLRDRVTRCLICLEELRAKENILIGQYVERVAIANASADAGRPAKQLYPWPIPPRSYEAALILYFQQRCQSEEHDRLQKLRDKRECDAMEAADEELNKIEQERGDAEMDLMWDAMTTEERKDYRTYMLTIVEAIRHGDFTGSQFLDFLSGLPAKRRP